MSSMARIIARDKIAYQGMHIMSLTDFLSVECALVVACWLKHAINPYLGASSAIYQINTLDKGIFTFDFETLTAAVGTKSEFQFFLMILLGAFLMVFILQILEGYRRHVLLQFRKSLEITVCATLIWLLLFPALNFFLKTFPHTSRVFIILSSLLIVIFLIISRFLVKKFLHSKGLTSTFREQIIILDWTAKSEDLARDIQNDPLHPYEIVAVCPPPGDNFTNPPPESMPLLDSFRDLEKVLAKGFVHTLIKADVQYDHHIVEEIVSLCEKNLVSFMMIPTAFQILLRGLHVSTVNRVPVLGVMALPIQRPFNKFLKRCVDLCGSLVGLLLSGPIIAVFCLLVYLESPGPVFYRQIRSGRNGMKFNIIKIRSMRLDAENESGPRWATQGDDRRLRVGAFMRRWNIDELPQFWNVLMGDMSLVGPRPERPELIRDFKESINHYNTRHSIVPGVTGWAQVNGLRGDTDLSERIRYDLFYIENWSMALDLQIMLMTFYRWEGAA